MSTTPGDAPEFTLVTSPACHLCEDAHAVLQELADAHRLRLRVVDIQSPEGLALIAAHRPTMNPLVLSDGLFFSAGRLPRGKLGARLARHVPPTMVARS